MEEKNKSGKGVLVVLIIILLLALCGTCFYIAYDKVLSSEKKVETKNDVPKNSLVNELKESDVTSYLEKAHFLNTYFADNYPIKSIDKIPNQELLSVAYLKVLSNGRLETFSSSAISDSIHDLFGADCKFKHEDINCHINDGVLYKYNSSNETYSFTGIHGHGGHEVRDNKVFFLDAFVDEEKGIITINTKVLYSLSYEVRGPLNIFYAEPSDTKPIYKVDSDTDVSFDEAYEKVKDRLPITTYTFVRNSDYNYGLKSIESGIWAEKAA